MKRKNRGVIVRTVFAALATLGAIGPLSAGDRVPNPPDWDLTPIFLNAAKAAEERAAIQNAIPELARWKGKLSDPALLRAALDARSSLRMRAARYWAWANLRQSRDGSDEAAGADMAAAMDLQASIDSTTAYLEPELLSLGPTRLAELIDAAPLAPYRKMLVQLKLRVAHVLSADREALISNVQPLLRRPAAVRDTLFNVELPYPSIVVKGETRRLTFGATRRLLTDPDRATRRAAWEASVATQDGFKLTQAALLSSYLDGVAWEAKVRGWSSQTDMVTASDPMPAAAFTALESEAERAAKGPLTRYASIKARALGLPTLTSYDLPAAIVADNRIYTIDQAKALTLEAVAPMGIEYQNRLKQGFAGKWIDWHPGATKAPGGLTIYGVKDLPAYISINYSENAAGLAIFAHEWGHWLHWEYARESGRPFETLAPETSTNDLITFVHEILVADREIAAAKNRNERIAALTSAIEALRTSYYGVIAQARFDLGVRSAADAGVPLTPESVSAIYCDARKRYAPESIAWDPRDCLGWVTEPYVYYDLYFYRYLLATSAAAWFAERIAAGDPTAPEKLKALLRAGSSEDGPTLLKRAGFDAADPKAYSAMTRRMEKLTIALDKELGHSVSAQ